MHNTILIPGMFIGAALVVLLLRRLTAQQSYAKRASDIEEKIDTLYAAAYQVLSRVPILSVYLENMRRRIYSVYGLDEKALRHRTISICVKALLLAAGMFAGAFFFMEKTLYNGLLAGVVGAILYTMFVNRMVGSEELMEELQEAIKDLKYYFTIEKVLEEAYGETIKRAPYKIRLHLQKIQDILNMPHEQGKGALGQYYEECSNKYLKILAAYSFLTVEYGDVIHEGKSLFHKNMSHLIAEIRNEYRKQRNISRKLVGEKLFVLSPIFLLPMIRSFVLSSIQIPGMEQFYRSSTGYIALLACMVLTICCYIAYMRVTDISPKKRYFMTRSWEDIILKKIPLLEKGIGKIVPDRQSAKYRKLYNRLIAGGKGDKVEWFYLKKVLLTVTMGAAAFLFLQASHRVNIRQIQEDLFFGADDRARYHTALMIAHLEDGEKQMRQMDQRIVEEIKKDKSLNRENSDSLRAYIRSLVQSLDTGEFDQFVEIGTERIATKVQAIYQEKTSLAEALVAFLFAVIGFFIPNMLLYVGQFGQDYAMDDEVMSFRTILLLLIYHEKTTPEMVIDWLLWFSHIFYPALSDIKNNYKDAEKGGENALKTAERLIEYKPFQQILHSLILAEEKTSMGDVFGDLEQDQSYNEELRRDNTEIIVERKVGIAARISYFSMMASIFIYLVAPMFYYMFLMLIDILELMDQAAI